MSFRWTTTGPWQHTACGVCQLTYTGSERDLLRWQRGHDKDHDRNAQLVARQARIDAQTRCASTLLSTNKGAASGILKGHKAAPITSRGLTAKTLGES